MDLGVRELGFLLCALAFGALIVRLRPGTNHGTPRIRLRIAALAMVGWSVAAWWIAGQGGSAPAWAQLLPIAVMGIWIWQLEPFASWQGQPRWLQVLLRYAGALAATVLAIAIVNRSGSPELQPSIGLALGALGLFALEQLYRNANAAAAPALRWIGLGIGGVLVTELVVFAEVLLTHHEPPLIWHVRGGLYAACALAIARGARQMPDWSFGLSVSRRIVFYAGSIMLLGGYLLLMGITGSILLNYSGGWSLPAQLGFAILAALALGLSLFAGGLLRWLKVFISAHFYPHRYDYRAEWLRFTETLAEGDDVARVSERAIRAVAQIVASPRGSLWCVDETGKHYEHTAYWPAADRAHPTVDSEDVLPKYLAKSGWLVDLAELRRRPAMYQDLILDPQRYAAPDDALIVPLLHREQLYGWIVLDRSPGLRALNFEDRDLLKTAGRQVAAHLAQFDADARLVQARQFETYNRMTAFVMHDLKNIAAQLRLITQNAERHRRNTEFVDDAFRTIASSVGRMTKLVSQLGSSTDSGTLQSVDLATIAERAAMRSSGRTPVPQVVVQSRPVVFADMERLAAVVEHAIRNAQDATSQGDVRVEVGAQAGLPYLSVIDTGTGMDAAFIRERLFRPFDTTKGTRGMGIGAFQIREYVMSLGGQVEVQSEPGRGTTLRLIFARTPVQFFTMAAG
jgi:putative PEP-CTERM system histidine kinase